MINVAVLGATGYTALEALKILLRHPEVTIVAVTSRQEGRPAISTVHPSLVGRLELPLERCWLNIDRYGNTSSASLPTTLDEANRAGRLKQGDVIAMMAIGAGMAWGSALVRW